MAEISLRVYQSKLEDLLGRRMANEVIAHSRHILTEYPKNLKAYSQMGQALSSVSRWEEAAELFRRLLGALPYDYVAHSHLGKIYQQLGQIDDAIWHVERAYDQQPNNSEIVDLLRTLYKQHRGKDIQRLQLTAGAVAQQHIRNNLYLQAVSVLDKALKRYPNRIDLRVLRARALWLAERHMDAAESAVDVLATLPYSLVANRILTELWLMEQRPSDAQRYLSRVEDLDPYLAYRLATGESAPESLIMMAELDYDAISRHELATANPDWLNTMGDVEAVEDEVSLSTDTDDDDMSWLDTVAGDAPAKKVTDDLENLLSDEWQAQVNKLDTEPITDEDLEDLFGNLDDEDDLLSQLDDSDDDLDDLFEGLEGDETDLDELFGEIDDDDFDTPDDDLHLPDGVTTDDLPEGLLDRIAKMKGMSQTDTMPAANRPDAPTTYTEAELTGMLNQLDTEEEDMSWLTEVQQGDFDTATDDDNTETPIESDWLQELEDIESSPDAQRVSTGLTGMFDDEDDQGDIGDLLDDLDDENAIAEAINPDDPTAWMRASGIEFSEDEEQDDLDPFDFESEGVSIESDDVSPVAWLGDSSPRDDSQVEGIDADPLAWMESDEVEIISDADDLFADMEEDDVSDTDDLFADIEEDDVSDTDDLFADMEEDSVSDTDDLFADMEEDSVSDTDDLFADIEDSVSDTDDLFADMEDSTNTPTATSDDEWLGDEMLDEMFDLESEDFDFELDVEDSVDALKGLADASAPDDRRDTMNDDLNNDWQSEQPDDDNDSMGWLDDATDDDGLPQFFGEMDDESKSDTSQKASLDDEVDLEDMFAQMSEDDFDEDDSGLEWLEAEELIDSADDVELMIEDSLDDDDDDPLSWLTQADTDDLGEEQAESTGMTDMLNALDDDEEEEEAFSLDMDLSDSEDEEEEASEGAHWLDRVALSSDDGTPSTEVEADWLADIDIEGEFGQADGEEVEWLAEDVGTSFEFEGDDESEELVDLFDFEDEKVSEFDFDAEPLPTTEDQPDWLSTLDSVAEGDTGADDEDDDASDWFPESDAGFSDEDDELEDLVGEQPDWLSGVARDEESPAAVEATDDWLSELGEFDEDEEIIASDDDEAEEVEQPDWLSDVALAGAGAAATLAASDILGEDDLEDEDEDGAWIAELGEFEDDDEEAEEGAWMAELGDFEEEDDEEEIAVADLNWMDEDEDEHSSETVVGLTSDMDYLEEVDPVSAESALDWMTDADDEDEVIFEGLEEQPLGITDFLNETKEEVEATADGADWLTEMDDFEDDEAEEVEQPDWLSASSDFETEDEPVAAEEPDWLSASSDFETDDDEADEVEEPDWLSASSDFEIDEEPEAEAVDWLSASDELEAEDEPIAEGGFDFENDPTIVGRPDDEEMEVVGEADWLSGMDEGDGVQDAFADELVDEHGWGDETSLEEAQSVEQPDWLASMGEGDGVQDAFAEAVSEIDGFEDDDDFDSLNVYETDDEDDVLYEEDSLPEFEDEEFSIEETVPSSGLAEDDYLADFDEEIEHTPADDAPDWLNAMVPGLDIDYEAEEDEPVDQGFVSTAQTSTTDKGFDWLEEIVEEETGPIKALAPRPQMVTAPRFQFSKPPAWLEKLRGGVVASIAAVASMVSGDDDVEVDNLGYLDDVRVSAEDTREDLSLPELDMLDTNEADEFDFDTFADDDDDDDGVTFTELDALDMNADDDFAFDDDDDDDDDDGVTFTELEALDMNADDEFAFDDDDDDDELTFDEFDDLDDNFDTQLGSANAGNDELPDWLDFDDED